MGRFDRAEIEKAFAHYTAAVDRCSDTGDWSPFADLFTEDVVYTEHAYGVMHGREAVREWIVAVMAPFPHMRFPHAWTAFDEENDAIVVCIKNQLELDGKEYWFPNWSRMVYGGDGLFSEEEDIYNPRRDAPDVVGAWLTAGGQMLSSPIPMKHY
jgi:hypothetical protein